MVVQHKNEVITHDQDTLCLLPYTNELLIITVGDLYKAFIW